jgi:hypothetical protein
MIVIYHKKVIALKKEVWHYFSYNFIYMNKYWSTRFLLVTTASILLSTFNYAQAQTNSSVTDIIETIRISIKASNSKELTTFMGNMVEIQLPDQDRNNYSKTQAEFVMRDFMKKYPPTNFTYIHKVLDKEDFKFTIGEYVSTTGSMRVTMVLKPVNGNFLIDSIIIEHK